MKHYIFILMASIIVASGFGQVSEIEYWRDMGYQSKVNKDFHKAILYYGKILKTDHSDYDARLALARLCIMIEKYDTAIVLFNEIYLNDSTDVEAMNGLGEVYGLLDEYDQSVFYFEKSLKYYTGDIRQYFQLADAYKNGGRLNDAITIYEEILKIDNTYSEAWAGIGKMYYWKGMPMTATKYYLLALSHDEGNEEIKKEYQNIQNELKYALSIKISPLREKEETYEIGAIVSSLKLEKRVNDWLFLDANFLLDFSNRNYSENIGDTNRMYNNAWIKGSYINEHNKLRIYGGYTASDQKFSTYGANWIFNTLAGKIKLKNSLMAGYDYFYYWNKVGSKSVSEEIQLGYKQYSMNTRYAYGIVDPVLVYKNDSIDTESNPYHSFGVSLYYKVLKDPEIKIGVNYSYLDYLYKSPLYYSPFGRNLTGVSMSIFYPIRNFYAYGNFSYNLGTEVNYEETKNGKIESIKINVNNWSSNIELGYNLHPFSFSIGESNFYNPYYQNLTFFIAVKVLF